MSFSRKHNTASYGLSGPGPDRPPYYRINDIVLSLTLSTFSPTWQRPPALIRSRRCLTQFKFPLILKGKITHSPWQNPLKETNMKQGGYITDLFPPLYHKFYQIFISYRSIRKIVCYHSVSCDYNFTLIASNTGSKRVLNIWREGFGTCSLRTAQ